MLNEIAATALLAATFVASPAVCPRFGGAYAVLTVGVGITIWSSNEWVAPGDRYLLPVVLVLAALVASWLSERRCLRAVALSGSTAGSLLFAVGFAGTFRIFW